MPDTCDIALAFPRGAHQEMLIDGVLEYASEHNCRWSYVTAPESLSLSILELKGWQGDAVIAALNTPEEAEFAESMQLPIVNISSTITNCTVPRVNIDNRLLGEMAAEHLIRCGFPYFAYYGLSNVNYSEVREEGFVSRLATSGFSCNVLRSEPTFGHREYRWLDQHRDLSEWLRALPTPVAVFTVSDYRGRQTLDSCREAGLHVPQDVAVLGVDNEEVICQHVHPKLSSIARNDRLEGYNTAAVLHQLLKGLPTKPHISIPPVGVIERESTEVLAVSDERIRESLSYIFQNLDRPFGVGEVAAHLGVSRRWLEYTFREAVGESPYKYIRRQRLEHARRMLTDDPSAKIYQVAQRSGFSSAKRFMTAFRQAFGLSPREYRRSLQA